MSEAVELVIKRLTDRLFDCLSDVEGEPVEGVVLKDDAADILEWARQLAAWNRRAKPSEGEPVAWLIEWVFKNSDPATIKRPGGGSMVARCRAEMEAQVANLRAWDRVAEYTVTALAPLYTRPVAWPDREAAPDLLEAARAGLLSVEGDVEARQAENEEDGTDDATDPVLAVYIKRRDLIAAAIAKATGS